MEFVHLQYAHRSQQLWRAGLCTRGPWLGIEQYGAVARKGALYDVQVAGLQERDGAADAFSEFRPPETCPMKQGSRDVLAKHVVVVDDLHFHETPAIGSGRRRFDVKHGRAGIAEEAAAFARAIGKLEVFHVAIAFKPFVETERVEQGAPEGATTAAYF